MTPGKTIMDPPRGSHAGHLQGTNHGPCSIIRNQALIWVHRYFKWYLCYLLFCPWDDGL